ncbi:MAG: peptide ABC transporter substrate-binding protein [Chloroflexi bacterium]|nr:peptide ABC transporter substrate-binding protein [Chloroflexota bacterium]
MKHTRSIWLVLSLTLAAGLILTACGAQAAQPPAATQPPASTQPPPATTEAPTAMSMQMGAPIVIAMYQEPESINPYLSVQTVVNVLSTAVYDGLLTVGPDGEFIPVLATEVPSVANGGLSADGLTVTYKLREGVKWADGKPFTSADVKFTWQALMDNSNAVVSRAGWEDIDTVETPNDLTAVVKFKKLYAPALTLWRYVLPAHGFGGGTAMTGADFNRKPFGTGPFFVKEWTSGESIVLENNPNANPAPLVSGLTFRITPSREESVLLLKSGEVEAVWDLIEASIPDFQNNQDVTLWTTPSSNVEYLGLNLAQRGNPADPTKPHAILGDIKVRQALSLAIDRSVLVNDLMYGKSTIATSAIGLGWASDPTISIAPYDPEKAKSLLDEAGWKPGSDGIRMKGGQRLSLEITSTSGNKLRELAEQVIQEQLKAVGIELKINNVPSSTLFGNWASSGPLQRGNFDISMDTWGPDIDPNDFVSILFESASIPTEAGGGWNYFRINDPKIDAAIKAGRSTLDIAARKQAYSEVARLVNDTYAYIPLYNRLIINAFTNDVSGWTPNPWRDFTWDAAKWAHK